MANEVTSFEVQGNNYDLKPNLTFDTTPTIGSSNPVTSNGIALAVQAASIGTDISVGREEGTPIGYCSIAYGENNTASADYGIVFGQNNTATSEATIITGVYNESYGTGRNAIFGANNHVSGVYNMIAGIYNKSNIAIRMITDERYPRELPNNQVFIGYINTSTMKIYHDPSMTNEIVIPEMVNGDSHYFVNLATGSEGDVYEYRRDYNTYTLTKIAWRSYVDLTNACSSDRYYYQGICYFNPSTDKNYYDESMTNEIPWSQISNAIYLDLNDGSFVLANNHGMLSNNPPTWVRKKVYKGSPIGEYGGIGYAEYWGRRAYISLDYAASDRFHVYTSSDHEPLTDITNRLYDGEIINDITTGYNYIYQYNVDRLLVSVIDKSSYDQSSAQLIVGADNSVGSGRGAMLVGDRNIATGRIEGGAIIGKDNIINNAYDSAGNFVVAGDSNRLTQKGTLYGSYILGRDNSLECLGQGGEMVAIGHGNKSYGSGTHHSFMFGSYNEVGCSDNVSLHGATNKVFLTQFNTVIGDYNEVSHNMFDGSNIDGEYKSVKIAKYMQDGRINIDGTPHDIIINPSSSDRLPTHEIFLMYGNGTDHEEDMLSLGISSDGTSLSTFNLSKNSHSSYILGCYNRFYNSTACYTSNSTNFKSSYNYMVGAYNEFRAGGTNGVGLIGYHLKYRGGFGNPAFIDGAICLGAYNDDSSSVGYIQGGKTQLIVGIGTSDNDRKNGFVVMQGGQLLAPECPDTISEASSSISSNPNKLIVTYGMLQDYAPRTPGAVGKPAVALVTLTVNGWSSDEQTVSVSNMSTSCVVIAQPNGNPYAYNYHEVYVKEQGTDQLTFKCGTAPQVDIQVKVVYWT